MNINNINPSATSNCLNCRLVVHRLFVPVRFVCLESTAKPLIQPEPVCILHGSSFLSSRMRRSSPPAICTPNQVVVSQAIVSSTNFCHYVAKVASIVFFLFPFVCSEYVSMQTGHQRWLVLNQFCNISGISMQFCSTNCNLTNVIARFCAGLHIPILWMSKLVWINQ